MQIKRIITAGIISVFLGIYFKTYYLSGLLLVSIIFITNNIKFILCFVIGYFIQTEPPKGKFDTQKGFIIYSSKSTLNIKNNLYNNRLITVKKNTNLYKPGEEIIYSGFFIKNKCFKFKKIKQIGEKELSYIDIYRIKISKFCEQSKYGEFLKSVMIGDKPNDEKLKNRFSKVGLYHLFIIAGLHISIICRSIFNIMKKVLSLSFWINYNLDTIFISKLISILFGYIYLLLSFSPISGIRALIMFSINFLFNGRIDKFNVLSITALIMVLFDTTIVFDLSFQLSFLATLGSLMKYRTFIISIFTSIILLEYSIIGIITNFIAIKIFDYTLILIFISCLFNIKFLIPIIDYCITPIYWLTYLSFPQIIFNYNDILILIFFIILSYSILKDNYKYLWIFILTLILMNLFISLINIQLTLFI